MIFPVTYSTNNDRVDGREEGPPSSLLGCPAVQPRFSGAGPSER